GEVCFGMLAEHALGSLSRNKHDGPISFGKIFIDFPALIRGVEFRLERKSLDRNRGGHFRCFALRWPALKSSGQSCSGGGYTRHVLQEFASFHGDYVLLSRQAKRKAARAASPVRVWLGIQNTIFARS